MTANLKPLTVTFVGSEVSNLGSSARSHDHRHAGAPWAIRLGSHGT